MILSNRLLVKIAAGKIEFNVILWSKSSYESTREIKSQSISHLKSSQLLKKSCFFLWNQNFVVNRTWNNADDSHLCDSSSICRESLFTKKVFTNNFV